MQTPILPKRIPDSFSVGERAEFTRTITEGDMALFIGATWDVNPLHTDETYARQAPFGRRCVPGLLTAGLLTHLGGLWAFVATEMHFEFLEPVFPGDTITAQAEVVAADPTRGWARLRCWCSNQDGVEVLRGQVEGFPGRVEAK